MKPERDPVLCAACDCPDPDADLVATPEGAMCEECAHRYEQEVRR